MYFFLLRHLNADTWPPAIENTKFQIQYGISREGSGVGIEMSQEKKVHTVEFEQSELAIEKHLIIMSFLFSIQIERINKTKLDSNTRYRDSKHFWDRVQLVKG